MEKQDQDLDTVIADGIRFLDSITRHYGSERGIEMWEAMGAAMGQEVKGKIFFRMLTGVASDRIDIQRGQADQAVQAIRAIRIGTGMSLKEAKDVWVESLNQQVTLRVANPEQRRKMERELRDIGMIVS